MSKGLSIVRSSSHTGTPADRIESMDQVMVAMLDELTKAAIARASVCTESIFKLSTTYVTKPAFDALSGFYELYFSKQDSLDHKKMDVNAEVDALFEAAVRAMETGDLTAVREDEKKREERLALAALQKRLEGLIVLDQGIKDEIMPAVASMQFEDAVRQRLEHITTMWNKVFAVMISTPSELSARQVALEMSQLTTSVDETKTFYRTVLGEEAPSQIEQGGDGGLSILF